MGHVHHWFLGGFMDTQGSVKVPETLEKETVHRILSLQ
ncbi:MAG: hypothetical protein AVDCRST_MAG26-3359 [uncultured Chloroflexia bacterium]|uniref:Uncharacterized protein n=2 Tax=uncultured Chloroflexia bacterium TaxID=1672391 RepID=A0A6J4JKC4_9CHLR|nr:MAG: hypothetical protein AVDCRST_MAG26-3359 [uncultured Chloroflexia bacterium]